MTIYPTTDVHKRKSDTPSLLLSFFHPYLDILHHNLKLGNTKETVNTRNTHWVQNLRETRGEKLLTALCFKSKSIMSVWIYSSQFVFSWRGRGGWQKNLLTNTHRFHFNFSRLFTKYIGLNLVCQKKNPLIFAFFFVGYVTVHVPTCNWNLPTELCHCSFFSLNSQASVCFQISEVQWFIGIEVKNFLAGNSLPNFVKFFKVWQKENFKTHVKQRKYGSSWLERKQRERNAAGRRQVVTNNTTCETMATRQVRYAQQQKWEANKIRSMFLLRFLFWGKHTQIHVCAENDTGVSLVWIECWAKAALCWPKKDSWEQEKHPNFSKGKMFGFPFGSIENQQEQQKVIDDKTANWNLHFCPLRIQKRDKNWKAQLFVLKNWLLPKNHILATVFGRNKCSFCPYLEASPFSSTRAGKEVATSVWILAEHHGSNSPKVALFAQSKNFCSQLSLCVAGSHSQCLGHLLFVQENYCTDMHMNMHWMSLFTGTSLELWVSDVWFEICLRVKE